MKNKIYLQPLGFLRGCLASEAVKAHQARWLAGGPVAFNMVKIVFRKAGQRHIQDMIALSQFDHYMAGLHSELQDEILDIMSRITAPRPTLKLPALKLKSGTELTWDKPLIQGIVNVTPDSFSDGGLFDHAEKAVAHAHDLIEAGADIIDIGGESTRPGAKAISLKQELDRVIPMIEALSDSSIPISIDSRNASVMAQAIKAGAHIINDVSALRHDDQSLEIAVKSGCPVILMHSCKNPENMQDDPHYDDVLLDVYDELEERIMVAVAAGIEREKLIIDPGIGFGKTVDHNLELLAGLGLFHGLGQPLLLGVSRKSFIGYISGEKDVQKRLPGSLAAAQAGYDLGVQIIRVHDVAESRQARDIWRAIS